MARKKILFLGHKDSPLVDWLHGQGEQVVQTGGKLSVPFVKKHGFAFLVSYGYRHILAKDILDLFPARAINLHISYLPWNRGADPNFWSFVENTPKGVTIHYLDEGVDTGDVIVQRRIEFDSARETLASSYRKLQAAVQELFRQHWQDIKSGKCQRQKQLGTGSAHSIKDKESLCHLLRDGWNTRVSILEAYSARADA